jgi:hypothetical protein
VTRSIDLTVTVHIDQYLIGGTELARVLGRDEAVLTRCDLEELGVPGSRHVKSMEQIHIFGKSQAGSWVRSVGSLRPIAVPATQPSVPTCQAPWADWAAAGCPQ